MEFDCCKLPLTAVHFFHVGLPPFVRNGEILDGWMDGQTDTKTHIVHGGYNIIPLGTVFKVAGYKNNFLMHFNHFNPLMVLHLKMGTLANCEDPDKKKNA